MDALFIPITLFVCVALMVLGFFYFQYRARFEYQHTVRLAMERGQQLTPELLERLGHGRVNPARNRDLRFGVVAIAIGIAIASFGWILGEPDTVRPLMGVGNLPILVGVAMLLLAKFAPRE